PTVQVIDLAQTSTDAELMALMEYVERAIYKAFAVPESEIGDASQRTYSNAGEEYRVFWTRTMVPLLAEIADDINTYLAPELGDEVGWFDLSGVEALRPAKLFADIAPDNALKAGMIVSGEWRQDVGLPWELPAGAEPPPEPETTAEVDDPGIEPSIHSSSREASGPEPHRVELVDVRHGAIDRITALAERRADFRAAEEIALRYDVSPIGLGKNWVTSVGGLPLFIRAIAHALMRNGHSESEAIQLAVGVVQNWASGRGKVKPETKAKAAAALAEWEAKKAASHAKSAAKRGALNADLVQSPGAGGPELWVVTDAGHLRPIPNERDAAAAPVETESGSAGLLLPTGPAKNPQPRQAHVFKPSQSNRRKCATCGKSVTAAGHLHTGRRATPDIGSTSAMVALYPPAAAAKKIAVANGLPASELHITLAYLGKDLTPEQIEAAHTVVASVAKEHAPLAGTVGGLGQFPAGDDGVPHYAPVDVPNLADMRTRLVQRLSDAGVPVASDHGFTPHMTLTYLNHGDPPPAPVATTKVGFDALVLKHGPDATPAPFGGSRAAGEILARIETHRTRKRHRGPHLPVVGGHANTPDRARQAVRKMIDRHVSTVESHMRDVLSNLFDAQGKATVARMTGNRGQQMIKAALRAAEQASGPHEPTPYIDPNHIFDTTYWTGRTAQ
ncbi:MAG TPA: phage portal protein, partial [Mycobacterium sp.]|nr:phage portal protein [Mycobacterium sp.]